MKLSPRTYFILAAVMGITFFVLIYLKIDFMTYGFLGVAIGSLFRGFYEENKKSKEIKNNTQ